MDQVSRLKCWLLLSTCHALVLYDIHLTFDPIIGYTLMLLHFYTMIAPVITVVILSMHSVVVMILKEWGFFLFKGTNNCIKN